MQHLERRTIEVIIDKGADRFRPSGQFGRIRIELKLVKNEFVALIFIRLLKVMLIVGLHTIKNHFHAWQLERTVK